MDMEKYYTDMINEALEGFKRINNTDKVEQKKYELPSATWIIKHCLHRGWVRMT